jgi:hypothetical protein
VAENVLGTIFSRADSLKRQLYDMIRNPSDYASMVGGRTQENMAAAQALQNEAFADPQNPLRITNPQALSQLTQMITSGPLGFAPAGITAFHGSPYLFRQFDPAKISSGEGAQAYGVGAGYTAEARPVAEEYARNLANREIENQGRLNAHANAKRLADLAGDPKYAADDVRFVLETNPDHPQKELLTKTLGYLESGSYKEPLKNTGYLYKGDIPDEILPKFLDWDKPLSQQSNEVKEILKKYDLPENIKGGDIYNSLVYGKPTGFNEAGDALFDTAIVKDAMSKNINLKVASDELEKLGIRGIRYLDQGSRGEGKGTSNFIPFRAEDYKIQEINDTPIEDYIAKGLL